MKKTLKALDREIAAVSRETSLRLDLHGRKSRSYTIKHAELLRLRNERYELKCELASANSAGGVLAHA